MITSIIALCLTATAQPILLDGEFTEWPATVSGAGSPSHVYLQMILPSPVNLQGLDNPMTLAIDWDNNKQTGNKVGTLAGTDLEVLFSPGGRGGVKVRRSCDSGRKSWDTVKLVFSPTVASDRFEFRFPRTLQLDDSAITAQEDMPWQLAWDEGGSVRGTATVTSELPDVTPVPGPELIASTKNSTRVMTWNLEKGNLIKQREVVTRVFMAIRPDIVLVQEILDGQTADDLEDVLEDAMPNTKWTAILSPRSGNIKSAIATRLRAKPIASFNKLKRRGESHGHVRAVGMTITVPGVGNVLAVSAHLKCCGIAGGPEDLKRIGEVMAIRRAIKTAAESVNYKGLIIGGDLNLVGGLLPLQMLIAQGEGLIADTDTLGDLLVVEALQSDGQGVQTWQEDGQSYTPGRLDYLMVTESLLKPVNAFVLDTDDLTLQSLEKLGLQADDTTHASDHLPVVVDLTPTK